MLFRQILPEADRQMLAVQAGIDTFADGDGVEVLLPELLEKPFVGIHQFVAEEARKEMRLLLFETDFGHFAEVVIIAIRTPEVVKEPTLVGKTVFQVRDDEREDVVHGLDGREIRAVRRRSGHIA